MVAVNLNDLLLTLSASAFMLGMITFSIGVFILVTCATGHDFQTLTEQTTQLVSKGITEDLAGLVGNAATLLSTMSDMVRTAAGVGVFLTATGTIVMGASLFILLRIQ